jgi:N-acetylglutamate synthase-like GNAT family acetyltransferase/hypoxanthine phosphoribosyltransferase
MNTIHLSDDQVRSYVRDLARRISDLGEEMPQIWATIGFSGSFLGKILAEERPDLYDKVDELIIAIDRSTNTVSYPAEENSEELVKGKRVLIIDGTVHSGLTLLRVIEKLEAFHPAKICSYALAVRRNAGVIPNNFGFLIGDFDRVQLPTGKYLFNNRLSPFGTYRKLREEDAPRPMINTGTDFIDKIGWDDRWYEVSTDSKRHVYLHDHNGSICGFVNFRCQDDGDVILLDEVGVDQSCQGNKLGGHLMRWAEHFARHANFSTIELWAVDDRVEWYSQMGFERTIKKPINLSDHSFIQMSKKILYNLPGEDHPLMGY